MTRDLTEGSPLKRIIEFFIPLLIGNIFQQLYNMADTVIVGKFVGINALGAVGSTGSLNFLCLGFLMGLAAGMAIPVAQSFGAKNYETMRKYAMNSIYIAIVIGIIMTVLTYIFTGDILHLLRTPTDLFDDAYSYISTVFLGIIAILFYNLFSSIMRAMGDSKIPLIVLIISSLMNIGLDLLFIISFGMRVFGAALATIISQFVSSIVCGILVFTKYPVLRPTKEDFKIRFDHIGRLLGMGLPMGFQMSITAIGATVMQSAINKLGTVYVNAVAAGLKISQLFDQVFIALGTAMATYAGQNIGAGKLDRIRKGVRIALIIAFLYGMFNFALLSSVGQYIALIFVDGAEEQLLSIIHTYHFFRSMLVFGLGFMIILRNVVQGMGYSAIVVIVGVIEMIARSFVAFYLVDRIGDVGVYISDPVAWLSGFLVLIPTYIIIMGKEIKKKKEIKSISGGNEI